MRFIRVPATALLLATWAITGSVLAQSGAPTLTVDASASRHPISPDIYGIANYGLDATFAKEIQVGNIRWGGDGTTRYNWQVDSSNAGFDWYFMGGNGETSPVPSASADLMVNTYKPADALITIPIIPYVNKMAAWSCSFPVSVYGPQQSTNPYVHPNGDTCGNSIATNGTQLTDSNIYANHIDNTTSLQQQWVQHLVSTFGTAANGGVKFYQLDNEPYGWSNTHRDVMPNGATYPTITQLGEQYAAAVKQADSSAMVLGPSDFTLGGWVGNTSQQGGLFAGQYYLQQMAAYDKAHGQRILDYFDEHYYFDTSTPAAQLASTRTLWDPTYNGGTWVEQYEFNGPMQLIPRFRGWISTYYPGTLLSLSEYSIDSGNKSIVDAIAEMDVLGIFGRQPIDFANMWNPPAPQDPIAYAFRMFRNYDGNGSQFGDTSVSAISSDQGSLSIYAAQRSNDNAITILVINKTTAALTSAIAISNVTLPPTAQVYSYSQASLTSIVHPADAAITNGALSYTFPGYSALLFVVQPAATAASATTTSLSASATQISAGQSDTFSVTVSAASGPTPSGTVSLMDGSTSLASATLASGAASFTISSLSAGTHSITASYAGDSTDASSTSSVVQILVGGAQLQATTVTLASSSGTAGSGQAITLTATVAPSSATGTITFKDGGNTIGSAALTSGKGLLSINTLSAGTHTLTATYSGDSVDSPATSNTVTVTISGTTSSPVPDYALALSSNTLSVAQGTSGSLKVSVTPENGFSASLSFACTGLPNGWSCSFSPSTLSGSAAQSTTMTVSAMNSSQGLFAPSGMILALVSPLSLLPFGWKSRTRWALIALCLLSLTGCGGSSSNNSNSTTSQQGQPATYNVTVTASGASAPAHAQTFVLTMTQ
ncbi:MAG TPA: glycoside hydrolase family 44 protein [Acidobacteriaceae bacterium]|nr:glycoside hydrolase family 44 protein [Acidobacteriaceae bacterium]